LPTTPTGKVDVRALHAWELVASPVASTLASSTPLEQEVAATWAELLGVTHVDPDRDFFELGGNSLLAVRALQLAAERWGVDVSLSRYFAGITVRDVAALAEDRAQPARLARLSPLSEPLGAPRLTCLLPFGVRAGLLSPLAEALSGVGVTAMNWSIDPRAEGSSVESLARACSDEILRVLPQGPHYLAGISNAGIVALEVGAELLRARAEVRQVVLFDSYPPGKRVPLAAESQRAVESFAAYLLASYQALPSDAGADLNARLSCLLRVAVQRGVLPLDATLDELVSMFEHDRAQREALRQAVSKYEFQLPDTLGVTLLQATHARDTSADGVHWLRHIPRLRAEPVAGTHWGFCDPEHVHDWARALSRVVV
jgi:thioesterase domain-containing protein